MSGTPPTEQDNSIEEILASIRQIISEDDPAEPPPPAPVPEPEPAPTPPPAVGGQSAVDDIFGPSAVDDIFDLVETVEEKVPEPEPEPIEIDFQEPEPELEPEPEPEPEPEEPEELEPLSFPHVSTEGGEIFTDMAASATLGAFSKLSETVLMERQRAISGAITLEDIVKDLLTPLLREWIDRNVPGIVERLVREELEKLARTARDM